MHFTARLLASSLCLLVVGQSLASDLRLSFRNIYLGETMLVAETKARQRFDQVKLDNSYVASVLRAGDAEGLRRGHCPISALPGLRPNCLRAVFGTHREGKVQFINVMQSFSPSIPLDVFIKRLNEAYGPPRASYKATPDSISSSGATEALTFIWGGSNIPAVYPESSWPRDVIDLIGGRFASTRIYVNGIDVIGYELGIYDAEEMQRATDEFWARRKADAERKKRRNVESLGF